MFPKSVREFRNIKKKKKDFDFHWGEDSEYKEGMMRLYVYLGTRADTDGGETKGMRKGGKLEMTSGIVSWNKWKVYKFTFLFTEMGKTVNE